MSRLLTEEHFELFKQLRIKAMGDKLREMIDDASYDRFTFEEKMGMILDAELSARRDRKIAKYVKQAGFKTPTARSTRTASRATSDASGLRIARSRLQTRKPAAASRFFARRSATPRAASS